MLTVVGDSVVSDSPVDVTIAEDVKCASVGKEILVVDGSWLAD